MAPFLGSNFLTEEEAQNLVTDLGQWGNILQASGNGIEALGMILYLEQSETKLEPVEILQSFIAFNQNLKKMRFINSLSLEISYKAMAHT